MALNYSVTEDALWVMMLAEMAATRDGRTSTRPADVLLALILVSDPAFRPDGPPLGGLLLRACVEADGFPTLQALGWSDLPGQPSFGGRLTAAVTDLLDDAARLSTSLGARYMGSEHILVSLVAESFDEDVDQWLTDRQLTEATVLRAWVALLLGERSAQGTTGERTIG